jgi:hypothetical protein
VTDLIMTGADEAEIWPLVRDYHYSRRSAGLVRHAFAWRRPGGLFGETGEPVAGITYSQPVNRNFPAASAELSRLVRRDDFSGNLSAFVTWTLRWLRANTETPFILSYADTTHNHHGGIYQACGFVYVGATSPGHIGFSCPDGTFVHGRICNSRFNTRSVEAVAKIKPDWRPVYGEAKHLYIFPLRQRWSTIARRQGWESKPYPKPTAARLLDAPVPSGASEARTLGAAPDQGKFAAVKAA